jgi:spore coat protein U-like protein
MTTISIFLRRASAFAAGAAFVAATASSAGAVSGGSFTVSTTITASCSVTNAGPSDLSPTYSPVTDTGTGAATSISTVCTGPNPQIAFTDLNGGSGTDFVMTNGSAKLYYYLSSNATCDGTRADRPLSYGIAANGFANGSATFGVCAAVEANGTNTGLPAGTYTDTVYYTISP